MLMKSFIEPIISRALIFSILLMGLSACKESASHTKAASQDPQVTPTPSPEPSDEEGAPEVDAGTDQLADPNVLTTLAGVADAAEGAVIERILWAQVEGPTVALQNADQLDASFIAPDTAAPIHLTFRLSVHDNQGRANSDTVRVTVSPISGALRVHGGRVEEEGSFAFIIQLSQPARQAISINYETQNGSAVAGEDYQHTRGTVTIAAGARSTSVTVPILADEVVEGDETLTFSVSARINGGEISDQATLTIIDNDTGNPGTSSASAYLDAYVSGQGFLTHIVSQSNAAGVAMLDPIIDRYRSNSYWCPNGGSYTSSLPVEQLPTVGETVTETMTNCRFVEESQGYESIQNGTGIFELTAVSGDYYEPWPVNTSFSYRFETQGELNFTFAGEGGNYQMASKGVFHYENYNFDEDLGVVTLALDSYMYTATTPGGGDGFQLEVLDANMTQELLPEDAFIERAGGTYVLRIPGGTLKGQQLDVTILDDTHYDYSQFDESDSSSWRWPTSGRERYSISDAVVIASYAVGLISLEFDLNGNGCADHEAELTHGQMDQYLMNGNQWPEGTVRSVPESPCQTIAVHQDR